MKRISGYSFEIAAKILHIDFMENQTQHLPGCTMVNVQLVKSISVSLIWIVSEIRAPLLAMRVINTL